MRRSRHLKYILTLAITVILAGLMLSVASYRNSQFKRFTSKPLPDGSRFTFLYPAYLKNIVEGPGGSPGVIHSASIYDRGGEQPGDVNRTPWGSLARQIGFTHAESVTAVRFPLPS